MQTKFVSVGFGFRSHLESCADGVTILLTQLNSQTDRYTNPMPKRLNIFIESRSQLTRQT